MKITLCGSTKFMYEFHRWNQMLTLKGHVVYSVATNVHGDWTPTDEEKTILDLVHLKKIAESDAILVVSKDGYIGESTTREIMWAGIVGKEIYCMERAVQDRVEKLTPNAIASNAKFLI
jgi:hypothetical protein